MLTAEERRLHQIAATRRWRERNPDKVKAADHKKRHREYDPANTKRWRTARLENPAYRKRMNQETNRRATNVRRWLDAYKIEVGCVDCGFNSHPSALHFDHVTGKKTINVCNSKSIAAAKKEIRKCVVRCANCHAVKTWPNRLDHKSE